LAQLGNGSFGALEILQYDDVNEQDHEKAQEEQNDQYCHKPPAYQKDFLR